MLKILERLAKKCPAMTTADIKATLPELSSLSDRTIQRHLQITLNLLSRSAAQKPLLTDRMKKKRLAFCRKYKNWTAADWGKVMYSDESTFRCIRSIKSRVRRAPGSNRFDGENCEASGFRDGVGLLHWRCGERGALLPAQKRHHEL
jgi:hypothetical protein